MLPVSLQGSGKWELIYANNLRRQSDQSVIEPFDLPCQPTTRYLAVGTKSLTAKATWIRAGYLIQYLEDVELNDGFIFPGSTTADLSSRLIRLNQVQIIAFSELANSYRLFFQPMFWLTQLSLSIWEFTGNEINNLDLLTEINNKLPP